ncbi:MAG TPA: hypothetical protein DDW65_08350 [Firmicutes bacterium]|jgi:general secretion pathway protein G|nr:hypothetical protein [Bacillota bacterium]
MMNLRKRISGEHGFTLIEVMIVVIILAVLSGIALISFGGLDTQAKDARVQADFRTIATALKAYKALSTLNAFPTDAAGLNALTTDDGDYHALLDTVPIDPYTKAAYTYDASIPLTPVVHSGSTAYPSITVH